MRILYISNALPPNFESQTIRNIYIIKGLQDAGHKIFGVRNSTTLGDESLDKVLSFPLESIVVKSGWFLNFLSWISSLKINFLKRFFNILGPLLIIPDINSGWSKEILKNQEVLSLVKDCDLIISASGSYESHLAGFKLSKMCSLPLICEMGDPWALNPIWPESFWLKKIINKRLESSVIKHSSAVIFTTKETKQLYQEIYKNNNFHHIPMGFSKDEFDLSTKNQRKSSKIDIVYVGIAYKGSRDITPLLDKIYNLNTPILRAKFFGKVSDSFKEYVSKKNYNFVKFFGQISYEDSIAVISNAHVLVILGNNSKLQIPGKTYMYLASGKPIIYLANQDLINDPTWNLIQNFDGVYGFDKSLRGLDEILFKISEEYDYILKKSSQRMKDSSLKKFDWEHLGKSFNSIVESVHGEKII